MWRSDCKRGVGCKTEEMNRYGMESECSEENKERSKIVMKTGGIRNYFKEVEEGFSEEATFDQDCDCLWHLCF